MKTDERVKHRKTGQVGLLKADFVSSQKNVVNVRVICGGQIIPYKGMKEVFTIWELEKWNKDAWHGEGNMGGLRCGVLGCDRPAASKGFCKSHWVKILRYGTIEEGKCVKRLQNGLYKKHKREYNSWSNMKQRCLNPKHNGFQDYGGRGIGICRRWIEPVYGFANFLHDMGSRPPHTSLDRVDVDGDYSPENCLWSDNSHQAFNKRFRPHSTKITGVTRYFSNGRERFGAYISKNYEYRQKFFEKFEDAVLWRAKQEESLYGTKNMQLDKIVALIKDWGRSHKIDNALMQYCKTTEELSELAHEFTRGRQSGPEVIDALGDTTVCLIILADILGYDLMECLESAYNVIKYRKGHTKNGSFVKEVDASAN